MIKKAIYTIKLDFLCYSLSKVTLFQSSELQQSLKLSMIKRFNWKKEQLNLKLK